MSDLLFLSEEAVLAYHEQQIQLYGGDPGIMDHGLLESALAQPQNTWLYKADADVFDVAAAYAFHIAKNHPFSDGNKRTALMAALGFLKQNQIEAEFEEEELFNAMIALTEGRIDKLIFAELLCLDCTKKFFQFEKSRFFSLNLSPLIDEDKTAKEREGNQTQEEQFAKKIGRGIGVDKGMHKDEKF